MREYYVQATVLARRNIGETDRFYTLFTKDRGILNAKAKGVRKIQSKLASSLEPFTFSKIRLTKGRKLDIVIGVKVEKIYNLVGAGFEAVEVGFLLLQLCKKMISEELESTQIFNLLEGCFAALSEGKDEQIVEHYFFYKFLELNGSLPEFSFAQGENYFNLDRGVLLKNKDGLHCIKLTDANIKLWHLMRSVRLADMFRIKDVDILIPKAQKNLLDFCKYHFDIEFNRIKQL